MLDIPPQNMSKPRLLWIDDEYIYAPELRDHLIRIGWAVDCAASYCEAKVKLSANNYVRILLDMIIPYSNSPENVLDSDTGIHGDYLGLALLSELKSDDRYRDAKSIIILSVVEEDRLASTVNKYVRMGLVQMQLSKKAGVTVDEVVSAVGPTGVTLK